MRDFLISFCVVYINLLEDKLQAFWEAAEAILSFKEEVVKMSAKLAFLARILCIF